MKELWGGITLAFLATVAAAQELPAAKSKATFEMVCSACHKLDSATSQRHDPYGNGLGPFLREGHPAQADPVA